MGSDRLTAKQRAFVAEYLVDQNGTQAAIRAGYSEESAASQASDLLRIPKVRDAVKTGLARRAAKLNLKGDDVLRELMDVAFLDPLDLFDENGIALPIEEIPERARRAISNIELEEIPNQMSDGPRTLTLVRKIHFSPKLKALELLAKNLKLLTDLREVKHTGQLRHLVTLASRLNRAKRDASPTAASDTSSTAAGDVTPAASLPEDGSER